jgi:pyrroline-5-carboxylate reductase
MTSTKVAFVGLGAMGFGMASHLVKKGYDVIGYDVYKPTCVRFQQAGGRVAQSPREAALEAKTLICMVTSSQQVDSVLFDSENGAVEGIHFLSRSLLRTANVATFLEVFRFIVCTNNQVSSSSECIYYHMFHGFICLSYGNTVKA